MTQAQFDRAREILIEISNINLAKDDLEKTFEKRDPAGMTVRIGVPYGPSHVFHHEALPMSLPDMIDLYSIKLDAKKAQLEKEFEAL